MTETTSGSAPSPAVDVRDVEKSFPRKRTMREIARRPFVRRERSRALRGVSLAVARGEFVGLLGPNGAGKTTLLKVLCGLVFPDRGTARVLGVPVESAKVHAVVGLAHGEERSFYWRLSGRENLQFFARLYGLSGAPLRDRVEELLARVNLAADGDRRFSDYSSGMRQRLAIARALLADPPLLLMDEPTRSLDPLSAAELREWIAEELHGRQGKTIVLATHNLREAETLCRRVVVLDKGLVRADGAPDELRRRGLGGIVYRLRLAGCAAPPPLDGAEVLGAERGADGELALTVRLAGAEGLDPLLGAIRDGGGRVLACAAEEPDLEQAFRRLVAEGR